MYQRLHSFVIVYVVVLLGQAIHFRWFLLAIICVGVYVFYVLRFPKWLLAILLVFGICVHTFVSISPTPLPNSSSNSQTIDGTITSMVEKQETHLHFSFQIQDSNQKTDVYYFDYTNQKIFPTLRTGSTCKLTGSFQKVPQARNPGQFDYQQYLQTQGISSQFILDSLSTIECQGANAIDYVYQLRFSLLETLQQKLSMNTFSWSAALLFGDKTYLDEEITNLFQNWQLSHLLAISGLHVGLLISMIYIVCLYLFRLTFEKTYFFIMLFLPIYPFLSGGAPSVWRASLLALALLILRKTPVQLSKVDVLSIVFLCLVFVDSSLVYSIAFQFSFLVTYGILLSKKIVNRPDIGNKWLLLRVSLISMLIILPIQLHHFYAFNPLAVFINLFVIPYFTLFVLPLLVGVLIASPLTPLLHFLDILFQKVHRLFILCLQMVDHMADVNWLVGSFPLYYYIPYYLLLSLFFIHFENGKAKKAFISGCMLVVFIGYITIRPYMNPNGYITVLDIGQGDAIVIELPYREGVIMIDAGGTMNRDFSQSSIQTFEQIIDPFLQFKGISRIDGLFLSHKDHDHVGSVPYIVENYDVEHIITSPFFDSEIITNYQRLNTEINHLKVTGGEEITIKNQIFHIHFPDSNQVTPNENSLVIRSRFGDKNWLFTGDIGVVSERKLISQYPLLQADVLKVAHHGSQTSTSSSFLQHIDATYGLISAGENNRYGHPHDQVLESLSKNGVSIFRTDRDGALIYQYRNKSGTHSSYLP